MDRRLKDYLGQLARNVIDAGVMSIIWRMPWYVTLVIVVVVLGLVVYFGLY